MVASRWWSESRRLQSMNACTQSLQRSHFNRSLQDTIPPGGGFRVSSVPPAVVAHASTAASRCQRYSVPSVQMRCISTASLRATATAARRRRDAEPPNPDAGILFGSCDLNGIQRLTHHGFDRIPLESGHRARSLRRSHHRSVLHQQPAVSPFSTCETKLMAEERRISGSS